MKKAMSGLLGVAFVFACSAPPETDQLGPEPLETMSTKNLPYGERIIVLDGTNSSMAPGSTRLVTKSQTNPTFVSQLKWFKSKKITMQDGNEYDYLEIPGEGEIGKDGQPRLPRISTAIRIPNNATAKLVIDTKLFKWPAGYFDVSPVQPEEVGQPDNDPEFVMDNSIYSKKAYFRSTPVWIQETMTIRGNKYVYVVFAPIAFNPVRRRVRVAKSVNWHLELSMTKSNTTSKADPFGEEAFAVYENIAIDVTAEDTSTQTKSTTLMQGETGADYLIVTHDDFYPQAKRMAEWKHQKGLKVKIVTTTQVPSLEPGQGSQPNQNMTANDLIDYLTTAYSTWNRPPTYLLLLGDAQQIPPYCSYRSSRNADGQIPINHASCTGNVTIQIDDPPAVNGVCPSFSLRSHDATCDGHLRRHAIPTDLYYGALDGADYQPDIFVGRISCQTQNECETAIGKILAYEKTPNTTSSGWNTVLTAGEFQDRNNNADGVPTCNGIADRYFLETANAVSDYWTQKGYQSASSYVYGGNCNPDSMDLRWRARSIMFPRLSPVHFDPNFLSHNAATNAVVNGFNQGAWLVQHRDHGGPTGWSKPYFRSSHVRQLTNGDMLPVVFSMNCSTGHFDSPSTVSFAESLLLHPGGGAAAVVAASRGSLSGYNDWVTHGMMNCMNGDYFETLRSLPHYKNHDYGQNVYGTGYKMGQVLSCGKRTMFDKYRQNNATMLIYELFQLFGDPEMDIRNKRPTQLVAGVPHTLTAGISNEFDVQVADEHGIWQSNAKVVFSMNRNLSNEHFVAFTDERGIAHFSFTPNFSGNMTVTVTSRNAIPYQRQIDVAHLCGDIDMNGIIDDADLSSFVQSHLNPEIPLNCPKCADVDGNGTLSLEDGNTLFAYLHGSSQPPTELKCRVVKCDYHSADTDKDYKISLSELIRVISLFNAKELHCDESGEDGYALFDGPKECGYHDSDFMSQDWSIDLSELLHMVSLFNADEYYCDPNCSLYDEHESEEKLHNCFYPVSN